MSSIAQILIFTQKIIIVTLQWQRDCNRYFIYTEYSIKKNVYNECNKRCITLLTIIDTQIVCARFEDYYPRVRLLRSDASPYSSLLFFNKATRLNVRKEEASFSATFLPFSSPFIVLISLYENGKTTTEVSRIQDSLDGHRGDEWIKLGIKLRWKFNFTRLVNMLILRAKILFYRPASGFCNCGKRKWLLWANKNARWIGWSSVFSTLPSRRAFS